MMSPGGLRESPTGRAALLALAVALAGCGIADVRDAPADSGELHSFDASYDRVKEATLDGVREMKIEPSSVDEGEGGLVILISRPPHGVSYGEVGRVVVRRSAAPPTEVQVNYEHRFTLVPTGTEGRFARRLFGRIEQNLRLSAAQAQ